MTKNIESFVGGWLDASAASVVGTKFVRNFSSALITSLDSEIDLLHSRIGHAIIDKYTGCFSLGAGIVIPRVLLDKIRSEMKIFHGFDEVWFFDNVPSSPKPDEVSLVAPLDLGAEQVPKPLVQWMMLSECRFAIGDGAGLNYVAASFELAKQFEKLSMK